MKKIQRSASLILTITVFSLFLFSCKKDAAIPQEPSTPASKAKINFVMKAGNVTAFDWDTLKFTNAAGNTYAVSSLNLYISAIKLTRSDGNIFSSSQVFYIDPSQTSKSGFTLENIPPGTYTSATFLVGLDAATNVTYGLPTTMDNLNMAWPDAMGGGYHFMKLEGYYLDSTGTQLGYAIHLGKNENLVTVNLNSTNFTQQNDNHAYDLIFDLNEVFANPYTYDLNIENNYTMADSLSMNKIKNNMSDAFTLIQNN